MVELEDGSIIVLGEILGYGQDGDGTGETKNGGNTDIWVFKLAPDGITKVEKCSDFKVSPNPVYGDQSKITFEELIPTITDLRIYDVGGRQVAFYPGILQPNMWETEVTFPQYLPTGVYLIQANGCSDKPISKKFLKVE